jgi:hypothetical protein
MKSMKFTLLILATILILGACKRQEAPAEADPRIAERITTGTPKVLGMHVKEARETAKPGEEIVVTGRIAGAKHPFSGEYATLILADDSLRTCDRIPGDTCPTPWDACCVESETIQASRLLVQLLGEDGLPIEASMKGVRGLKELEEITVVGSVDPASTSDNMILNAVKIHRTSPAR